MASSSESEKEWRAPDKREDQPEGSGSVATGSEKGVQGSRVEATGSSLEGPGVPLQPPPPQEPRTPPQDPDGEYVEVVVEVEPTPPPKVAPTPPKVAPTPPKVAPTPPKGTSLGKGHQKGVGRAKGKGSVAKAAGGGKLDSNMPKTKAQPKQPQVKAAPKILSAPSSSSKTPAKAVNLVPKGVRKVHLKARPDSLRSNPPLGRRWSAYPRKRRGKQQKGPQKVKTEAKGTQTPEIMTMVGHMERHEKLEEEAKKFAQLLEAHGNPSRFQARFPQVDLNIEAGRADIVTRSMVELTDRTSYTSPGPAPRQHPPPPPPPDVTMVDPAGAVPGSPSSFSFVTAPKTPDAGTAAVETPAPSSPPPATALNIGKKARTEEPQDMDMAAASISTSDQVGNADSQSNLPSRAPTSSWGYLGRSVKECDHKRPCAMVSFASPLPPTISVQDDANDLPVAAATARDCSHSAAVVERVAAGVEEQGSWGPVEQGSEGPVAQGSGVSPWMLAGDAAYLSESELSTLQNEHVLRSHIPYLATCEECQRARGLSPQRRLHEGQRPRNEIQADKFWFRGVAMLVLVAVGVGMLGTILWQPDRESMVSSFVRWSRSAGLAGSGEVTVSMRSDGEPALVSFLERCCRELPSASLEQVPVDRHAPNAERAIRTLKELAQVQVCSLEKVGLTIAQGGVSYLFSHLSVAHNRYHIEEGSALTPEQRCQQKRIPAHPTYIFGATVLCMPPPSVAHLVNGRLCKGAYLGPEVASASHWVRVQLNSGEFRIVRSPKIRMLMPLRYEVGLLRGICRLLPGRDRPPDSPPLDVDAMRALPLPNTHTRGPPKEWIAEHGKTSRRRACKIKFDSDKALHTPACRARYAKFLRDSFSPDATIAQDRELDQELGFRPGRARPRGLRV